MLVTCGKSFAQSDPTLSAMIAIYTNQAEKQLKSQEKAMLLQTTGHIWTKEEYEATTNFQRQFNDYLDSFRSVLTYAAQIYGFYYEVGKLTENMGTLTRQIKASPKNAIAVALTPNRNTIYRNIVITSLDIVNDIRQVCLSDIKMTEKDRVEIVFGIRPKIKTMNQLLQRLTLAVKYTSLSDVWREIDCRAMSYDVDKNKLSTEAFKRWRRNGYNIRPNKNLDFIIKDDLFIKDDILTKDEIFIDTLTNNNLWENGPQYYAPGNL
jgi:hypothetical protein